MDAAAQQVLQVRRGDDRAAGLGGLAVEAPVGVDGGDALLEDEEGAAFHEALGGVQEVLEHLALGVGVLQEVQPRAQVPVRGRGRGRRFGGRLGYREGGQDGRHQGVIGGEAGDGLAPGEHHLLEEGLLSFVGPLLQQILQGGLRILVHVIPDLRPWYPKTRRSNPRLAIIPPGR